jgi:MFS family permease
MAIEAGREGVGDRSVGLGLGVVILAGGPAVGLAMSIVQPVLPSIAADLAHGPDDEFLVKMLMGVMGAAMVLGAALTGFLADRIGLKRIMTANYALYALAGTAGVYLTDLHALIASRFLLGVAAAGAVTGSIIVINEFVPRGKRANWLGYYNAVAQFSSVLLNPVSGFLGELSWHWSFAIYGIAAPFVLVAFFALGGKIQPTATLAAVSQPLYRWFPYRFALIGLCIGLIMYIPVVYLPFLLNSLGMTSPAMISLVLTADIIAGSIAAILYGPARRVLSEYGAFVISFACAAFGLAVAALSTSILLVVIGSIFFGIGVAWFLPNLMASVSTRVTPEQQGRAVGLVKGAVYLGSPLAVILAEPAARTYGTPGAIALAGLVALTLFVAVLGNLILRGRPMLSADRIASAT